MPRQRITYTANNEGTCDMQNQLRGNSPGQTTRPRAAVVIPYLGRFPNYFDLFLHTCRFNAWIDWLIFTDQPHPEAAPSNVIFRYTTLAELRQRFADELRTPVALTTPYKLCDLRLTYGYVFRKELESYEYWGFGDLDVLYGDIGEHLTPEVFTQYDKVLTQGSFTLQKNCEQMNTLFRIQLPGIDYRVVFADPVNHIFDESNTLRRMMRHLNNPYFLTDHIAEVVCGKSGIQLGSHIELHNVNYDPQILIWQNGKILRAHLKGGEVMTDEFAYAHLQKRKMRPFSFSVDEALNCFVICPDQFIRCDEGIPPVSQWRQLNHNWPLRDRLRQELLRVPHKIKRIRREKKLRADYARSQQ